MSGFIDARGIDEAIAAAGKIMRQDVAEAMADVFAEKLSRGNRTGRAYTSYPPGVLASAQRPLEYPQEVSGGLLATIGSIDADGTTAAVGAVVNPLPIIGQLVGLEFKPIREGGRRFVSRAMLDDDVLRAAHQALEKLAR